MDAAPSRRKLGDQAERLVAAWLESQGLTVVARNVRLGYLEVDIVARDGDTVVVVEVRRRGPTARTSGFSSISEKKKRRLRFAGERLWNRWFKRDPSVNHLRFDVASVRFAGPRPTIEYAKAAF